MNSAIASTTNNLIPVIEMQGISKSFPGIQANRGIDLTIYQGEIHGLLGENGAGKSTLMSILAGLYRPDSGIIKVKGQAVRLHSPGAALKYGIGMIYQHFRLVENFTIAENIIMGLKKGSRFASPRKSFDQIARFVQKYDLDLDVSTPVNMLTIGEKQKVEILKMLYRDCDVLIMDEPTTILTPQEVRGLFQVLRNMARQGKAVVLITHKLQEVLEITDTVTVLKNGEVTGHAPTRNLDQQELTRMMLSRDFAHTAFTSSSQPGVPVLQAEHLNVSSDQGYVALKDTSLTIRCSEIVAVAGVAGNGQTELVEAIAGIRPLKSGTIRFLDRDITDTTARERIKLGLSFIPEDRLGMGLVPGLNILENSMLRNYFYPRFRKGLFFDYRKLEAASLQIISDYNIHTSRLGDPVSFMSGGNLQKLLVGREISHHPKLLIASYPLRGLDIGATEAIFSLLLQEKERGAGLLLVLEDLDHILRIADRIAVMYEGQIKAVLHAGETDIEEIGSIMLGAEVGRTYA